MKYYLGETFDKEKNKEYKKLDSGQKAAEREGLKLFDENGVDVTLQGKTPAPEATDVPEESAAAAGKGATQQLPEGVQLVDDDEVPEGALTPNEDESINTYNEAGEKTGTISAAEAEAAATFAESGQEGTEGSQTGNSAPEGENGQEGAKTEATDTPEDGAKEVHGKIRRIFDGAVRIRRSPSWAASAEAGVSKFTEKDVKALHIVDGKPMYATTDGFFISGAADIVEFIEE